MEEEEGGESEASNTCSCGGLKLEGRRAAVGSTVGGTELACGGAVAAAGCRGGWVEWMEAGAVLGPGSN